MISSLFIIFILIDNGVISSFPEERNWWEYTCWAGILLLRNLKNTRLEERLISVKLLCRISLVYLRLTPLLNRLRWIQYHFKIIFSPVIIVSWIQENNTLFFEKDSFSVFWLTFFSSSTLFRSFARYLCNLFEVIKKSLIVPVLC